MRRAFIVFCCLLAVGVAAVATLPWWLGTPLKIAGKRQGFSFERYERLDGGRFALHEIRFLRSGVEVRAKRVEGDGVFYGAWRNRPGRLGRWVVEDWQVVVTPTTPSEPAAPSSINGWVDLRAVLDHVFAAIGDWIAEARLENGTVRWPKDHVSLASAVWKDGTLQASDVKWRTLTADALLSWPKTGTVSVQLDAKEGKDQVRARSEDPRTVEAEIRFRDQPASIKARFAERGWLPAEASVEARNWKLAAADVGLAPAYETVAGSLALQWQQEGFSGQVKATTAPSRSDAKTPLLTADLAVAGDLQTVTVERLVVTGPGLNATLEKPVTVAREGTLQSPDTHFRIAADVAQFPWLEAEGKIDGSVQVARTPEGKLRLQGQLGAERVRGPTWDVPRAQIAGEFVWPRLKIDSGEFSSAELGAVKAQGEYDFAAKKVVAGSVQGELSAPLLARWLPEGTTFGRARFSATVEGSPEAPLHQGDVKVTQPRWHQVSADVLEGTWKGVGDNVEAFTLALAVKESRLDATGEGDRSGITLRTLRQLRATDEQLALTAPATLTWEAEALPEGGTPNTSPSAQLRVTGLRMQGSAGALSLDFAAGERGSVEASVTGLTPAWWSDFVSYEGPPWSVKTATLTGSWNRGPVDFAFKGSGTFPLEESRDARVLVEARGHAGGMEISRFEVASPDASLATLTGRLPVQVRVFPDFGADIDANQEFALTLATGEDAFFWKRLGELSGLVLENPRISANLGGTWRRPRGEAVVGLDRVVWPTQASREQWPAMETVHARLVGDGRSVTLDAFSATLSGQPLRARGRLPLPPDAEDWKAKDVVSWVASHLDAEISLPPTHVAAFASMADQWIAPAGTVSMNVALKPGMTWEGDLHLRGAVSRPFGPLGALQDVDADIVLEGRTVKIGKLEAKAGGQPVALSGSATHAGKDGWKLDFALKGKNLPLVRQTGLLVRGDIDLQAKSGDEGITQITGRTVLRDSLFLADVRSFIPRGGVRSSPLRRPPYFSVTTEPFAAWRLHVDVEGQRFLRLRTPVFSGLASARFRLQGTLAEPIAIGEALIDEGQVTLPFASLHVQHGSIALRESDPFDPRVSLLAASRRLGYDLRMEMTGSAADPNVVFSSSPPLDSEQVLRLVMAGEAPQQEVTYSGRQRAMRLGTYLGQSLAGQLGGDSAQAERFSLTVGERVSREGRETYSLEVPLDERWSLVGEYDEFDDYNVGVKWRAFRDRSKDPEPPPPENAPPVEEAPVP